MARTVQTMRSKSAAMCVIRLSALCSTFSPIWMVCTVVTWCIREFLGLLGAAEITLQLPLGNALSSERIVGVTPRLLRRIEVNLVPLCQRNILEEPQRKIWL